MWPFRTQPDGYTLYRDDGTRHNMIRGDMIPLGQGSWPLVIVQDGRHFVRTGKREDGFAVYREGHATYHYRSDW